MHRHYDHFTRAQGTVIRTGIGVIVWILLGVAAPVLAPGNSLEERTGAPVARPPSRGLLNRILPGLAATQREMNRVLSRELKVVTTTRSPAALATLALVAFGYGVLHASGPGHGKMVVSSFFLARRAKLTTGILVGGLVALLQVISAIAAVLLLALALEHAGFNVTREAARLESVSYGLVVLIGLLMTFGAITGRGAHRHPHERDFDGVGRPGAEPRVARWSLVVATGLTPCASAIVLLLFAVANGVLLIGVISSLVMALGMGITMAAVGIVTIASRRTLLGAAAVNPRVASWMGRVLAVGGPLLITAVGCLFFANAWTSLR